MAVVIGILPKIAGSGSRRLRLIRFTRGMVQVVTVLLLLAAGLHLLYVDSGTDILRAWVDPVYQYALWGIAAGVGGKTLGNILK